MGKPQHRVAAIAVCTNCAVAGCDLKERVAVIPCETSRHQYFRIRVTFYGIFRHILTIFAGLKYQTFAVKVEVGVLVIVGSPYPAVVEHVPAAAGDDGDACHIDAVACNAVA